MLRSTTRELGPHRHRNLVQQAVCNQLKESQKGPNTTPMCTPKLCFARNIQNSRVHLVLIIICGIFYEQLIR